MGEVGIVLNDDFPIRGLLFLVCFVDLFFAMISQ